MTGGPAFQTPFQNEHGILFHDQGMTLRDYFAAQALAGIGTWMPNPSGMLAAPSTMESRAAWAYQQADAMLKVRAIIPNDRQEST